MKKNYILLLLLTTPLIFTNCDDNDGELTTDDYFKAKVGGAGYDCGDTFTILFQEDSARVRAITDVNYLIYYADKLPIQYKQTDLIIKIKFRNPRREEIYPCLTFGIPFPHIIVEDVKE